MEDELRFGYKEKGTGCTVGYLCMIDYITLAFSGHINLDILLFYIVYINGCLYLLHSCMSSSCSGSCSCSSMSFMHPFVFSVSGYSRVFGERSYLIFKLQRSF